MKNNKSSLDNGTVYSDGSMDCADGFCAMLISSALEQKTAMRRLIFAHAIRPWITPKLAKATGLVAKSTSFRSGGFTRQDFDNQVRKLSARVARAARKAHMTQAVYRLHEDISGQIEQMFQSTAKVNAAMFAIFDGTYFDILDDKISDPDYHETIAVAAEKFPKAYAKGRKLVQKMCKAHGYMRMSNPLRSLYL